MKFPPFIPIAAGLCAMCLFAATGANAKGGSPGFHSFLHQDAVPFARPSHSCGSFAWTQRHLFVRTRTCLSEVYHHARGESFR
jgi:hypothetical protein